MTAWYSDPRTTNPGGLLEGSRERAFERQERESRAFAIANAARAYVAARKANEDAQPSYWMDALAEVDRTWHDLLVACGYDADELK